MSVSPEQVLKIARTVARRYHCPGYTSDDLRQEAVVAILAELQRNPDADAKRLYWRARRRLSRLCDRAARHSTAPLGGLDPVDSRANGHADQAEQLDVLLARLPARQREILELSRRGFSGREIAERLGISRVSVASTKCRAVKILRAIGKNSGPEG